MSGTDPAFETGRPRVAVLLSGSGRTLRNLLDRVDTGQVPVDVERVISTRRNVAGNQIALDAGLDLRVVPRREFDSNDAFSAAVIELLDESDPALVICAGFLSKLIVPDRYMGRIINVHPSLLPLFGGKGFFGDRVHQAVLESGMKVSGCTVHFVDNAYDAGPIIAQRCVPVEQTDSIETLARRVFQAECDLYPRVVGWILDGKVRLEGRRVRLDEPFSGSDSES